MNEIQPHKFEEAKNKIKEFVNQTNSDKTLSKVEEKKWIFDHKVTGEEFNNLVVQIQNGLVDLQKTDIKVFHQIEAVYDAFEALDKDYIAAILVNVKNAEEASKQAQEANATLKTVIDKQEKILKKQEEVIGVLKSHKEKLDKLQHLENIDDLWNSVETHDKTLNENNEQTKYLKNDLEENKKEIDNKISTLTEGVSSVEKRTELLLKKTKRNFIVIISILSTFCALSLVTFLLSILKVI